MQIVRRQQKMEVDLSAVLKLLWKKLWLILISGAVGGLLVYLFTLLFVTPQYYASVTLYANNSLSTDSNTSITSSDMNASARLVDTYAAIIMSDPVLDQVIENNALKMSASKLAKRISISQVYDTEVFKITVSYPSPKTAAAIANSIADIAPVKIAEIVDGCSVKIVSNAKVPAQKSYPDDQRAWSLGFLGGVVLSILVLFIIAVLDTRIKGESDLHEWEYPVFGVIPTFSEAERVGVYGYGNKENSKNEHIQ